MKIVKENLTLVISAAVALLILVFAFAPIPYAVPSLKADLVSRIQQRYGHGAMLKDWAKKPLDLPGWDSGQGIPPEEWVAAKKDLIAWMNGQQKQVETLARQFNVQGRINASGVPVLPVPQTADLSRSAGLPMTGFLPTIRGGVPLAFKENYGLQFQLWRGLLAQGQLAKAEPTAALPPNADELKQEFDDMKKAQAGPGVPLGMGGLGVNVAQQNQEFWDFEKNKITNKASGLRMYIEEHAFQVRSWFDQDKPPKPEEIFEAFVDSWFQSDLVKAILAINNKENAGGSVAKSPVKRLTRVMIGENARERFLNSSTSAGQGGGGGGGGGAPAAQVEPGQLFHTDIGALVPAGTSNMTPVPTDGNQPAPKTGPVLPDTANQTNYNLGMTGRSAGKTYDVVYMSVVLDMDPAFVFKFIDEFYRKNPGYTVTNIQLRAVNPLARASDGYLYGDAAVTEVELLFECILFRGWTEPLMPDEIKKTLGAQPPAAGA